MNSRRHFLRRSAAGLFGAALVSRVQAASLPEAPLRDKPDMAPPLDPPNGRPYQPVATLNGWTLPWRMKNGWKNSGLPWTYELDRERLQLPARESRMLHPGNEHD